VATHSLPGEAVHSGNYVGESARAGVIATRCVVLLPSPSTLQDLRHLYEWVSSYNGAMMVHYVLYQMMGCIVLVDAVAGRVPK
jgi:hypothetical protein